MCEYPQELILPNCLAFYVDRRFSEKRGKCSDCISMPLCFQLAVHGDIHCWHFQVLVTPSRVGGWRLRQPRVAVLVTLLLLLPGSCPSAAAVVVVLVAVGGMISEKVCAEGSEDGTPPPGHRFIARLLNFGWIFEACMTMAVVRERSKSIVNNK